jgi:hypothetical protein
MISDDVELADYTTPNVIEFQSNSEEIEELRNHSSEEISILECNSDDEEDTVESVEKEETNILVIFFYYP